MASNSDAIHFAFQLRGVIIDKAHTSTYFVATNELPFQIPNYFFVTIVFDSNTSRFRPNTSRKIVHTKED